MKLLRRRRPMVATVTTLRASPRMTRQFVVYHHHLGVDEVILFFDDPDDPSLPGVAERPGVTAIRCDQEHWAALGVPERPASVQARQLANVNWVLTDRSQDVDWVIHLDSDELLHAPLGLHDSLEREGQGVSLLQLPVLEAVPARMGMKNPLPNTHLFRVHDRSLHDRARALGAASGLRGNRFLRGHVAGKPAVRPDGSVRRLVLHRPSSVDPGRFRAADSAEMAILHYDAPSLREWKEKWRARAAFSKSGHRAQRIKQWERFERLDAAGDAKGLRRMYRRLYLLPDDEVAVLLEIGLLRRVNLPREWFRWRRAAR